MACITGVVTLIGVILSNSKSRAVMEVKLDALTEKVEKHNQVLERTYLPTQTVHGCREARHRVLEGKGGLTWRSSWQATSGKWRLLRTIVQDVLGVVVTNLDLIMG